MTFDQQLHWKAVLIKTLERKKGYIFQQNDLDA